MPEIGPINLRMEFTAEDAAVFLVGDWPARTVFCEQIRCEPSTFLHVAGDEIVITLANSTAVYRKFADGPCGIWICDKVERCLN